MTHNQINYWALQETKRSNLAREQETTRHNQATEGLDLSKLTETKRSNLANEEIKRGQLTEQERANLASEGIKRQQVALGYDQLSETQRSNLANEGFKGIDLNIQQSEYEERNRHNVASEAIQRTQAEAQAELNKANKALTDVQTEWASLKASGELELTQAQIAEVDARIDKYAADIARANSDIKRNEFQNINQTAQTIIDGLLGLSREARGWTSGKVKVKG